MDRSKQFLVTTYRNDLNKENIDEFMAGLGCMHYYAVFHPAESRTAFSCPHCHIYVKFDEKVDSFFVKDYFDSRCSVHIPKDTRTPLDARNLVMAANRAFAFSFRASS